ncbi:MAG: outer membrane beta-barrel protein [Flavobacteriaceae bacterium]|nr:outer membrane beta-barrel protein [Flavobacteriaceae bacterium]
MRHIVLFVLLCIASIAAAQTFEVKGVLKDKITGMPLESATVYVQTIQDSTLISYAVTNKKGEFEIGGRTKKKKLRFIASYTGYQKLVIPIDLGKRSIDLGILMMEVRTTQLKGVEVVGEGAPVLIKKDTLEFNANSFKTKPDANVEELLEKLPGVEVDNDGKITVNGNEVNEVLVNGKQFFGSDPKIATKNLGKDLVDKIQISDTKTDSQRFTGKRSNSDNKSINITLKKGKDKGFFGRVTAGYGSDDRYELSGMLNYFKGDQRSSLLASSNNINVSGFSYDEVWDMMGSSAGDLSYRSNTNQGITVNSNVGVNFVDQWGKGKEFSSDYFYATSDNEQRTKQLKENLLPDSRFFTKEDGYSNTISDSHKTNLKFEMDIDSMTRVVFRPSFYYTTGEDVEKSDLISSDALGVTLNTNTSNRQSMDSRKNFESEIEIIRKFGTKGAFLELEIVNEVVDNFGESFVKNTNQVYNNLGNVANSTEIDRFTETDAKNTLLGFNLEWRMPLFKNFFFDLEYVYEKTKRENEKLVYDLDTDTYSDFNYNLSSLLRTDNQMHRPLAGFNYDGDKLSFGLMAGVSNNQLENRDGLQSIGFEKEFNDLALEGRLMYNMGRGERFRLRYNTNSNIPSAYQLQPVENQNNLSNIVTGNPNLNRTYTHRLRFGYNKYDFKTQTGMFMHGNISFVEDAIVPITLTDENLLRRTTFTNVSGNKSAWLGIYFNKTIKNDHFTSRWSLRFNGSYNRNNNFSNGLAFSSDGINLSPRLSVNFNYKEWIEIEPSYNLGWNNVSYSLENFEEESFLTHQAGLRTTTFWPKNIVFGNDITYSYNPNVSGGFDASAVLWNMSLGLKMFKDKGLLKIKAYDLLNQKINTTRTITADYIQDFQSNVLQRYFMFSFTYKVSQVGGKNKGRRGRRYYSRR